MFRRVRVAVPLLAGLAALSLSACQKTDSTWEMSPERSEGKQAAG
jgi:hypothetical protein